jgi:hypothetical protein
MDDVDSESPTTEPAPPPASPAQSQPAVKPETTALEHEVRIATRNGRWALIAALCAAIVSGTVSAGSAIYVSRNTLDRSASLAAEQTVRADRQKAYLDFLNAFSDYLGQLAVLKGQLASNRSDRGALKSVLNEEASRGSKVLSNSLGVLLAGSLTMGTIIPRFATLVGGFSGEHVTPFMFRYLTPGGPGEKDDEGLLRDEASMADALDKLIDEAGTVYTDVLDQARTDLGFA